MRRQDTREGWSYHRVKNVLGAVRPQIATHGEMRSPIGGDATV